jgi:hypothetical protein
MKKSIILFLLSCSISVAQISITSSDLLGLIGNSGVTKEDTTGFIQVNVGSGGANQNWDFSSISLEGSTLDYTFLNAEEAPEADQFPDANLVQSFNESGNNDDIFYSFFEIAPDYINSLGYVYTSGDSSFFDRVDNDMTALPLGYGDSWISVETDTINFGEGYLLNIDSTYTTIDGWGSVTVPAGTFECLRLRDENIYINLTVFGEIAFGDTSSTISYEWITKDNFVVASIESMEGETNPDFTMAEYASILQSSEITSAISLDLKTLPERFNLEQNYPNPFNPLTHINYQLPANSYVTLKVYDNLGREVKTLLDSWQNAGYHTLEFDAAELASGVYFYRLQTAQFSQVKRMLLLK